MNSLRSFIFSKHCESSGEVKASSVEFGIEAIVKGLPFGLSAGGSDAQESMRQFCIENVNALQIDSSAFSFSQLVVESALSSFNDCVALTRQDFEVYHTDNHPYSATISGRVLNPSISPVLTAVGYDRRFVECRSASFNSNGIEEVIYGALNRAFPDEFTIFCERVVTDSENMIQVDRVGVQVETNLGPYSFVLQSDEQFLSVALASEADAAIEELSNALREASGQLAVAREALERKDSYPVLVVGPFWLGALMLVPEFIRPVVGCLRPQSVQDRVIADQLRLACREGYAAELVGEIAHAGGGACGQSVVQINCVRR